MEEKEKEDRSEGRKKITSRAKGKARTKSKFTRSETHERPKFFLAPYFPSALVFCTVRRYPSILSLHSVLAMMKRTKLPFDSSNLHPPPSPFSSSKISCHRKKGRRGLFPFSSPSSYFFVKSVFSFFQKRHVKKRKEGRTSPPAKATQLAVENERFPPPPPPPPLFC